MTVPLFFLYAARVILGVYAVTTVCSIDPYTASGTILLSMNSFLLVVSLIIYNTKHPLEELLQLIAHEICVIAIAASSPNILFAFFVQMIGTFVDVQRATIYLLAISSRK